MVNPAFEEAEDGKAILLFFPKPKPKDVLQAVHILNIILESIGNPGWMFLYKLTDLVTNVLVVITELEEKVYCKCVSLMLRINMFE